MKRFQGQSTYVAAESTHWLQGPASGFAPLFLPSSPPGDFVLEPEEEEEEEVEEEEEDWEEEESLK